MMRHIKSLTVVLALVGTVGGGAPYRPVGPIPTPALKPVKAMTLLWSDEFRGAAGTAPGPLWKVEETDCCGNEQQSYVNDRRTAAHVGDGTMRLRAIRETSATGRPYISGRLSNGFSSQPKFTTYGRWEARMLLPTGAGVFPAFWTLGDWNAVQQWPRVGEMDVMEYIGSRDPGETHGGIHTTAASDDTTHRNFGGHTPWGSYAGAWHVWSIDWAPGVITWSVDYRPWQTITRAQVEAAGARWKFDGERPQAVILNLAVGGDWAGPASGWDSVDFLIDWVRVWRIR